MFLFTQIQLFYIIVREMRETMNIHDVPVFEKTLFLSLKTSLDIIEYLDTLNQYNRIDN